MNICPNTSNPYRLPEMTNSSKSDAKWAALPLSSAALNNLLAQMKGHQHHGSKTQRTWSRAFPRHKARKDFLPIFYSDLRSKMVLRNADNNLDQLQERNNGGGFKASAKSW